MKTMKVTKSKKLNCKKEYHTNGNVKSEQWCLNGKLHREDGPAYIGYYEDNNVKSEGWLLNDKYHREDGPVFISYYKNGNVESEEWLLNNKLHREDGPAVIDYHDNGNVRYEGWYIDGFKYMPEDYLIEIPTEEIIKIKYIGKIGFLIINNKYVFARHWLKQDRKFYNRYKILF